jgi:acyl-coenzyme A synthetase/AMP-(fatty) acid ligase
MRDRWRKLANDRTQTEPGQMAAILFTSGSTGTPKGAVYTHGNFLAQVQALQQLYDIRAGEVDLATFPLFALYAPAMGMTSIIPDMDFTRPGSVDAAKIFAAIDRYQATTMFGSPALLDRCSRYGIKKDIKLPSLKRVLSAGAPVATAILERFSQLLNPSVQIHTPYGATESLPVSSIGSHEVLQQTRVATEAGKGICVGKPVAGLEVHIIAITDKPIGRWDEVTLLATSQIGEIVVSGPQVTTKYYNRPDATLNAKIFAGDGKIYHRMGDTGYLDESGRLWFCGRKSERVVEYDQTWFSACVEGVFNTHPKVYRTALVSRRRKIEVIPALCVELDPAHRKADTALIKRELLELGKKYEHTRAIRDIYFHPGFPVDIRHNAKINRAQLTRWARKKK